MMKRLQKQKQMKLNLQFFASKSSKDYWREREEEALKHYVTEEAEYDRRIRQIYRDMLDGCQDQINAFYGRYAAKEGISMAEAKKRAYSLDIEAYERKAKRYVREKDFSKTANEEMRLYNLTMKVNRLELLKAEMGIELITGHDKLEKFMSSILLGRTMAELKRQSGILGKTLINNKKGAESIVNASFHNATFSDRIWMHQDLLKAELSKLLQSGMIQGKGSRELAKTLESKFSVSRSNAERLMRTELARVQTSAQKQAFVEDGIQKYIFVTVGAGACDICAAMDGKVFNVADMMPGLNAAPMHPRCRCSAAISKEDMARMRQLLDSKLDDVYNAGIAEQNKTKPVDNSGKNSIIKEAINATINSGALTRKNDPDFKKREAFAKSYYQEIIGRDSENEISAVAKNSASSVEDIRKVYLHVFVQEHLFADGSVHKFDPDYDMAQSWFRLREGINIKEHDLVMLKHELMESEIIKNGSDVTYEQAHEAAEKIYNYKAELEKYLKENGLE